MIYSLCDLKQKEVINIENGEKLGFIDDIEFDEKSGKIAGFVIMGQKRLWGFLGKDKDIILSLRDIEIIGKDTVLVRYKSEIFCKNKRKRFLFENFFEKNEKNT